MSTGFGEEKKVFPLSGTDVGGLHGNCLVLHGFVHGWFTNCLISVIEATLGKNSNP